MQLYVLCGLKIKSQNIWDGISILWTVNIILAYGGVKDTQKQQQNKQLTTTAHAARHAAAKPADRG